MKWSTLQVKVQYTTILLQVTYIPFVVRRVIGLNLRRKLFMFNQQSQVESENLILFKLSL